MARKRRAPSAPSAAGGGGGDGDTQQHQHNEDGRPEDTAGGAAVNYAQGEAERYHGCATVRRLQADLTRRAVALMQPPAAAPAGGAALQVDRRAR